MFLLQWFHISKETLFENVISYIYNIHIIFNSICVYLTSKKQRFEIIFLNYRDMFIIFKNHSLIENEN